MGVEDMAREGMGTEIRTEGMEIIRIAMEMGDTGIVKANMETEAVTKEDTPTHPAVEDTEMAKADTTTDDTAAVLKWVRPPSSPKTANLPTEQNPQWK
jgi:hypothetical protein